MPCLYTLTKVHKTLEKPLGRPIISGNNSILKPLTIYRSFSDLIIHLEDVRMEENMFLVTLDIKSLYTSIPQIGLIDINKLLWQTRPIQRPSTQLLVAFLTLVLMENVFTFKGLLYHQISGTAMGATVAPLIANLYVDSFENMFVVNQVVNIFSDKIIRWYRYIDNVLFIWTGDLATLELFLKWIDSCDSSVRFTWEYSRESIHFLDILISIKGGCLLTSIYKKNNE